MHVKENLKKNLSKQIPKFKIQNSCGILLPHLRLVYEIACRDMFDPSMNCCSLPITCIQKACRRASSIVLFKPAFTVVIALGLLKQRTCLRCIFLQVKAEKQSFLQMLFILAKTRHLKKKSILRIILVFQLVFFLI